MHPPHASLTLAPPLLPPPSPLLCCRYAAAPAREVMCHAQQVEDALFARSHSKQVRRRVVGVGWRAAVSCCHPCHPRPAVCRQLLHPHIHHASAPCLPRPSHHKRSTSARSATRCAWRALPPTQQTSRASPLASRARWRKVRAVQRTRQGREGSAGPAGRAGAPTSALAAPRRPHRGRAHALHHGPAGLRDQARVLGGQGAGHSGRVAVDPVATGERSSAAGMAAAAAASSGGHCGGCAASRVTSPGRQALTRRA